MRINQPTTLTDPCTGEFTPDRPQRADRRGEMTPSYRFLAFPGCELDRPAPQPGAPPLTCRLRRLATCGGAWRQPDLERFLPRTVERTAVTTGSTLCLPCARMARWSVTVGAAPAGSCGDSQTRSVCPIEACPGQRQLDRQGWAGGPRWLDGAFRSPFLSWPGLTPYRSPWSYCRLCSSVGSSSMWDAGVSFP